MQTHPPKRRVLVIDDDRGMTALCRMILERTGEFIVREENSGRRALDTAHEFAPHLIFLDRHLPDRGGAEIAADLAADSALHTTPIVFITGDVDAALSRGGIPVLLKPVRAIDLIDTCHAWARPPEHGAPPAH